MRSRPLTSLLDQLEDRAGAFDALVLSPVLEHSAASELVWAPVVMTASEPARHSDALPALPFEKLLARMSGNFRSSLSRSRKKLERLSGARVICANRPNQLEAAFTHFLKIEASGWKGASGSGTAIGLDPRLHNFYRQLVERLGPTGQCEIHLLDVGLTPVAAQLGLVFGRRYYQIKIGYDETWAHLGPGNALLEHVLKSYANHPTVKYVDLVSGADWHEHWRPDVRNLVDRFVFRPSARGRLAWATLRGKQALRPVRKLLTEKLATLRDSTAARAPG
jgi:CelD/BcsL family acetyltransferase involved in cellulose biosynthesis